jgi:putative ABC transport system permease protein
VLTIISRLAPNASVEAAQGDVDRIAGQLAHEDPGPQEARGVLVQRLESALFGDVQRSLRVLQGAVGFVLLIACANVAGLLLTRATARQRDVAICSSLGAGRGRLVRLFLTESVILSLGGGTIGVALAWYALHVLRGADPTWLPRVSQMHMDLTVLVWTVAVSGLTGLGFGLVPVIGLARPDVVTLLKDSGHGVLSSRRGRRLQSAILVAQVALTLVLLVGAGLLMKSFWHLQRHDLGFDATNVLAFETRLPAAGYYRMVGTANGFTQLDVSPVPARLFQRIRERLIAVPGVVAAAGTNEPPAGGGGLQASFTIEGRDTESGGVPDAWSANYALVTPDFFRALRIPLRRGREFTAEDEASTLPVAIINESMARQFWPNDDPVGKRLTVTIVPGERPRQIVGVVGDTALSRWDRTPAPALYVPHAQESARSRTPYGQSRVQMTFVLRIDRPLEVVIPALRRAVTEVDSSIPVSQIQMLSAGLAQQIEAPRDSMVIVAAFGAVALLLALFGIYGVVAYGVVQRGHEIAVRMVLGARRTAVLSLVLRRFTGLTTAGMLIGLVGAMGLTRYLDGLLFDVTSLDAMTFVAVPAIFIMVATVAALVPAHRAATLDPRSILRTD